MGCSVLLLAAATLWAQPDRKALVPLYQQAFEERKKQHGPEHPKVARAASDLGLYLRGLGDNSGAVEWLQRALEIDEKALGAKHPLVGADLENLASVLTLEQALPLLEQAAAHPDAAVAARSLARLGAIAESRRDASPALALYKKALAKEEEASGAEHPRVAARLNDIALLSEPKQAEPLLRRALAIQEKNLGARHPETAATLNNLANVLLAGRRLIDAERLQRRALSILEETLGPNHPRVATSSSNLADTLRAKGDLTGARRYYESALAIDERAYGLNHPEVAADLENLAGLLEEAGEKAHARELAERARRIKGGR